MSEAAWEGEERRGMGDEHHRRDDNPTWRWVAVTALGVMTTLTLLVIQWGISFATTLNQQVQQHEKTIAIIESDVRYIKEGVDKLVNGKY